jgi:hypothetical protein
MTQRIRRAAGAPPFFGMGLLAGVIALSGCDSNKEGSVVLKEPLDLKTIGAPRRSTARPPGTPIRKNTGASKKAFVPG